MARKIFDIGFVDYNDLGTSITPVTLLDDVWTDVPNDGLGPYTNLDYRPPSEPILVDTSTGYLDFANLTFGSIAVCRFDFDVTPTLNQTLCEARLVLGTALGAYTLNLLYERFDDGSGKAYHKILTVPIYVIDNNTRANPIVFQVKQEGGGTLINHGVFINILGR